MPLLLKIVLLEAVISPDINLLYARLIFDSSAIAGLFYSQASIASVNDA
jgi:hypothetical protein